MKLLALVIHGIASCVRIWTGASLSDLFRHSFSGLHPKFVREFILMRKRIEMAAGLILVAMVIHWPRAKAEAETLRKSERH